MKAQYSLEFVEQARVKVYSRGNRSIRSVADELNVSYHTLKHWIKKKSLDKSEVSASKEKRPQDWSSEEQLTALHETHGLSEEALHGWCRQHGLFAHHLSSWKAAFCVDGKGGGSATTSEMRGLKAEIEQLKRSVLRKDKALAEAAALLILQKKFQALWEDEVK
jgi:hypothetical protein